MKAISIQDPNCSIADFFMNYYYVKYNTRLTNEEEIRRTKQEDALEFLQWLITHLDKVRTEAIENNVPNADQLPNILS